MPFTSLNHSRKEISSGLEKKAQTDFSKKDLRTGSTFYKYNF